MVKVVQDRHVLLQRPNTPKSRKPPKSIEKVSFERFCNIYKNHTKSIGKNVGEGLLFVKVSSLFFWGLMFFSKSFKGVSFIASQSDQMFAEIGFCVS